MVFHLTYYFLVVFTFLMTILQKVFNIVDLNIIDINKTLFKSNIVGMYETFRLHIHVFA